MKNAFTLITRLHGGEPIITFADADTFAPWTFNTAEAAEKEVDYDDAEDDEVVECILHDDGSIEIPSLGVRWTTDDIREQRGEKVNG